MRQKGRFFPWVHLHGLVHELAALPRHGLEIFGEFVRTDCGRRQKERFFPWAHLHGLVQELAALPWHEDFERALRTVPFPFDTHATRPFLSGFVRFVPGEHRFRFWVRKYGILGGVWFIHWHCIFFMLCVCVCVHFFTNLDMGPDAEGVVEEGVTTAALPVAFPPP